MKRKAGGEWCLMFLLFSLLEKVKKILNKIKDGKGLQALWR